MGDEKHDPGIDDEVEAHHFKGAGPAEVESHNRLHGKPAEAPEVESHNRLHGKPAEAPEVESHKVRNVGAPEA
jgi:hypothetical protein